LEALHTEVGQTRINAKSAYQQSNDPKVSMLPKCDKRLDMRDKRLDMCDMRTMKKSRTQYLAHIRFFYDKNPI